MASSTHTSLPKPFASGNVREWLTRFDICSDANGWDEKVRAVKLPTLLEGEALATWLDFSDDERKNYGIVKEKLTAAMVSTSFTTLEQFHQRKLVPGEALSLFLHELKQLLDQAMPKLEARAREQLLLHQFVAGLPNAVSRQLRATGDAKELTSTLERAKLLMSLEEEQPVASVSQSQRDCIVAELHGQVLALTEQVAALKHQNTVGSRHSVEHTRGQQSFRTTVSPPDCVTVASIRSEVSIMKGKIAGVSTEIMLDSGSSVSLLRQEIVLGLKGITRRRPPQKLKLVTASGESLPIVDYVEATVVLGNTEMKHYFVVVKDLITPVILGVDFLQDKGLVLDFTTTPVTVTPRIERNTQNKQKSHYIPLELAPALEAEKRRRSKFCAALSVVDDNSEEIEGCTIPTFDDHANVELPEFIKPCFNSTVQEFKDLFIMTPGIIVESSSSWMAPAVYVRKKSGELRLCVDYRELNKRTHKDAYPLPLVDEVQDRLSGSVIFSQLDLQSGYWQVPVDCVDQEKTAFCPGPGMGLFQFTRMPFGLSGAPSSFQRLMNIIMRGLPFVSTYIDDVLIHSESEELHKVHLREAFKRLRQAGLTLRGVKCQIGMSQVTYLGHVFSGNGMTPDGSKIRAVTEWPKPVDAGDIQQFLGLASYYRRYINRFADLAAPLHQLTHNNAEFQWTEECNNAFESIKKRLTEAPVLAYPRFDRQAGSMVLQTDASGVGLGAVLEQEGHWLAEQKSEGLLCRWAFAVQEYDFSIVYRKGVSNGNADALSRRKDTIPLTVHSALTTIHSGLAIEDVRQAQQNDAMIQKLRNALELSQCPQAKLEWREQPLRRFLQLWSQLVIHDGIVCRKYRPAPTCEPIMVPILPISMHIQVLRDCHNAPSAGHMGTQKTLDRVRQEAYWTNMARDVDMHCRECEECQKSKLPIPTQAPLVNVPVGRPWQMVAIDILEVPLSNRNNRYLLVVQDYFTKWPETIPIPDQTAARITKEMVKLFCMYGIPDIVHSDQGRNFESTIFPQTLVAFGIKKSHTTAYHLEGDGMVERLNRSLLQLLRTYAQRQDDWEKHLPLVLYAYRTATHSSTGTSPFQLMYGRQPKSSTFSSFTGYDAMQYQETLQAKLAELQDLVEAHIVESAKRHKGAYDQKSAERRFKTGDLVWLSIPTAGKLDPRWEGKWKVKMLKS
eukprot:Em0013g905a